MASYYHIGNTMPGRTAAADLSTKRHYAAKLDTDGKIVLAGLEECFGLFICNDPKLGDIVEVAYPGIGTTLAVASAAIAVGDRLKSTAAGKMAVAASTEIVCAIAMEAAAADNDVFEVMPVAGYPAA